ncbi:MAG: rod shape-determining protein MreC, partial [Candidatus Paceibacterota bacterium]
MKRTFLAKRNALLSARGISRGVAAILFSLFVLLFRLIAPNVFLHALAPAYRASDAIAAESRAFLSSFSDAALLARRNEKLSEENAALASENQALLKKAESLSALVGASGKDSSHSVLAGVLVRPTASPYDTLVLSAGESAGVVLGMEAFGMGGVPLGVVSSVSDDFSRVTLFSTPGVSTSGWVGSKSAPITILGAGAGAMQASIARAAGVSAGDVVFAPGPGMLPLGV